VCLLRQSCSLSMCICPERVTLPVYIA
jgi:hypothetical protein